MENKYNCRFFKLGCKCSLANSLNDSCIEQEICEVKQLRQKEQECERMRGALNKIRNYELGQLDIDWDEYETCCRETEYSPIIDYCEVGLGEVEDD